MNNTLNIIGYRFSPLSDLPDIRDALIALLSPLDVLGTILLAEEGINVALAGSPDAINQATDQLRTNPTLSDLFDDFWFKESWSAFNPFAKLKVRIRPEIIAFDGGATQPHNTPAPNISPETVKQWLDDGVDFLLLDARNNYEVESGTFSAATHLDIDTFRAFPDAARALADRVDKQIPVVTFCTGGIRCEKAAPWLLANGFDEVFQIEGGILNYFEQCDGAHWAGDCFVFDDRVTIDTKQQATGSLVCRGCHRAVPPDEEPLEPGIMPHEVVRCQACKDC